MVQTRHSVFEPVDRESPREEKDAFPSDVDEEKASQSCSSKSRSHSKKDDSEDLPKKKRKSQILFDLYNETFDFPESRHSGRRLRSDMPEDQQFNSVSPIGRRLRRYHQDLNDDLGLNKDLNERLAQSEPRMRLRDAAAAAERRRSTRHRVELFGTLNESLIQTSLQKKLEKERQEMEEQRRPTSMYDTVKRRREGCESQEDACDDEDDLEDEEEGSEKDGDEDADDDEEDEDKPAYCLRKVRRVVDRYEAPPMISSKRRHENLYATPHSPIHKHKHRRKLPAHGSSTRHSYKRHHSGSSTTSSGSDDEVRFERRKAKSMAHARHRCLPMNFAPEDVVGTLKDRDRARGQMGSSLADIDPMSVDSQTSFADVGGLDKHISSLKEMVIFPLLYPEVFQKFNIAPPRGVLFHGPPGTGKTLVARALANECSKDGQKVAFFMRKGADCLSKWLGESERQLRLLFDQAYTMRPSIIFFDEIDGLAPVRSTRQDQIHSSIVSTLLALMDGLDSRKEIVVIGATNRLDAIDPALRRPGRFDREFLFTLPDRKARQRILEIHTRTWQPKLSADFLSNLADECVGYCGADLMGLCTESALQALRRRYPQIYSTNKKLVLNVDDIKVSAGDFRRTMKRLAPASQRATVSLGRPLTASLQPLLGDVVVSCLEKLKCIFPFVQSKDRDKSDCKEITAAPDDASLRDDDSSDSDSEDMNIYEPCEGAGTRGLVNRNFFEKSRSGLSKDLTHRPRLLIHGVDRNGQSVHVGPAVLHAVDGVRVHSLDVSSLHSSASGSPEEVIAQAFREARRGTPSLIYLPDIGIWWNSLSDAARAIFLTHCNGWPPALPVLLLATANMPAADLPEAVLDLFDRAEQLEVPVPTLHQRREYFKELLLVHAVAPPSKPEGKRSQVPREELAEAPPRKPRELSADEQRKLLESEESTMRELRLFLRQVTWKLLADRKFKEFSRPVDLDEVDDYLHVVKEPMDLSTIMNRINSHHYNSCAHYLQDVDLITNNCLEYNPDRDQFDKQLRNRACELRDTAYALVYKDLDPKFEELCVEIVETRKRRGIDNTATAPSFVKVLPKQPCVNKPKQALSEVSSSSSAPVVSAAPPQRSSPGKPSSAIPVPDPRGKRFSLRVRGIQEPEIDPSADILTALEYRRPIKKRKAADSGLATADQSAPSKGKMAYSPSENRTVSADTDESQDGVVRIALSRSDSDKENRQTALEAVASESAMASESASRIPVAESALSFGSEVHAEATRRSSCQDMPMLSPAPMICCEGECLASGNCRMRHAHVSVISSPKNCREASPILVAEEDDGSRESDSVVVGSRDEDKPAVKRALAFDDEKPRLLLDTPCQRMSSAEFSDGDRVNGERVKAKLVVRKSALKVMEELLESLSRSTHGLPAEELEKVHVRISRCLWAHRKEEDKTQLVEDIKSLISSL